MGPLSTQDYKMPDDTNIFGDLSENALQSTSAMNAAQMGKKKSNQLQTALKAIQEQSAGIIEQVIKNPAPTEDGPLGAIHSMYDMYGNKKTPEQMEQDKQKANNFDSSNISNLSPEILGSSRGLSPSVVKELKQKQNTFGKYVGSLGKQLENIYQTDYQYASNPAKVKEIMRLKDQIAMGSKIGGLPYAKTGYQAGTGNELLPSGEPMSEIGALSTSINAGYTLGLIPMGGSVKKEAPAPVADSSNILPYGSYTLNEKGQKQYVTMKLSPAQYQQRAWEEASSWNRPNMPHPLGEYGAYEKSLQTTPDGRPIYH